MEDLLRQMEARRVALRAELEALERAIIAYTQSIESARAEPRPQNPDLFSTPSRKTRAAQAEAVAGLMDAAEQMILQAGKPLTRGTLLRLLLESGHHIDGSDKSKVLGTNLWRSKRFLNLQGVGYWPKSHPLPPQFDGLAVRPSSLF